MTFKRFGAKDIVHNTIVTKPEVSQIHSGMYTISMKDL